MLYWVRCERKVELRAGEQGTWSAHELEMC